MIWKRFTIAAIVLLLGSAVGLSFGAGVGGTKRKGHNMTYEEHYAVIMPGETLWQKCQKYAGKETILELIDRVRMDNGIKDPGKIQPGQRIIIRTKR